MIIIAIISPVGGSGKSSVALNLASLLSDLQHPVTLIEADPANLLAAQMGQNEWSKTGLSQGLTGELTWENLLYTTGQGFRFMPYGQQTFERNIQLSLALSENRKGLSEIINGCQSSENDIFIFDTAKLPNAFAAAIVEESDLNLVTLTPDAHSLLSIDPTTQSLLKSRGSNYFLLNRFKANYVLHLDIWTLAKMKLGHRLLPFYLIEDQALPEAFATGLQLQDYSPSSQLTLGLHQLSNWIDQELYTHAYQQA